MKEMYNLSIRLDLSVEREKSIVQYFRELQERKNQSMNRCVIEALADYIDYQSYTREQHLEDIRSIMREEITHQLRSFNPVSFPVAQALQPQEKTEEELARELTEDLDMFE